MKKVLFIIIILLSWNKQVFANEPITGLSIVYNNTVEHDYYRIFPGTFNMKGDQKIRTISFYKAESINVDNQCKGIICKQKIIKGAFTRFTFNLDNVSIIESSS